MLRKALPPIPAIFLLASGLLLALVSGAPLAAQQSSAFAPPVLTAAD